MPLVVAKALPQEIQLRRLLLPVGEHNVQIQMQNSAGQMVDVIDEKVTIKPKQSSFTIKHWNAPVSKITKQKPGSKLEIGKTGDN